MSKLSRSVRIAAGSICVLSLMHVFFWAYVAVISRVENGDIYPYTLLSPVAFAFSVLGIAGILVSGGIFRARTWARIAALVLAALVGLFCAFGILAIVAVVSGIVPSALTAETPPAYFVLSGVVYFAVFSLAMWWIFLFSRQKVAAQFSSRSSSADSSAIKRPSCPPPIALLAWLMIVSGGLSAISWPILLGKIPAMLFNHIYSPQMSQFLWATNTIFFLACGIGLLRLQKWSYTATIALHVFWLASVFATQISPQYPRYLGLCFAALDADQSATYFVNLHFSPLASAIATALPTALLIAGLFYYRRAFLQAVADSRRPSS